jgi:hypothetical protein
LIWSNEAANSKMGEWCKNEESRSKAWLLLAGSLSAVAAVFAYQFLFHNGRGHLGPDSLVYVAMAKGQVVIRPYHSRVLAPLMASLLANVTGVSVDSAFHLLTIASLLASLLMLANLLARAGAPSRYQAGIVLAFGSGIAVLFGQVPILVDPELLAFTCLTLIALDRCMLGLALVGVCLAALTKDYGVALVLPWAAEAYRNAGWRALAGALAPVLLVVIATSLPSLPNAYYINAPSYQVTLLRELGSLVYFKTIYIWAWVAMWPVLLISALELLLNIKRPSGLKRAQVWYAAILVAVPVLLVGDWDRSFMLLVPFACLASAPLSFITDVSPCWLLAAGGLATALARPYYTVAAPPRALTVALIAVSAASSGLIIFAVAKRYVVKILRPQLGE